MHDGKAQWERDAAACGRSGLVGSRGDVGGVAGGRLAAGTRQWAAQARRAQRRLKIR